MNAYQFSIIHETLHKQNILSKVVSVIELSKNLYIHYFYEHAFGHHRRVATPEDPCSAAQG
jgi:alkane 1-monooxygenase